MTNQVQRLEEQVANLTVQLHQSLKPTNQLLPSVQLYQSYKPTNKTFASALQEGNRPNSNEVFGLKGQGRTTTKLKPNLVLTTSDLVDLDLYNPVQTVQEVPTIQTTNQESQANKEPNKPDNPAFKLARRCQGFNPITSRDMGRVSAHHSSIKDDEARFQEAGRKCVRENTFYRYEHKQKGS